MDILITGDRQEFCSESFERRLNQGLSALNITLDSVKSVVRTAFGGAELRAEQFANSIGLPVTRIPLPDKMGKHARKAAINTAIKEVDAIIVLDDLNDMYCWHSKKQAELSGKPMAIC